MGTWRKYTPELLEQAVVESTSIAGVLRHLGLNQAGGTHTHISRMIKKFELDMSHFKQHRNGAARRRRQPDDILVAIDRGSPRTKPPMLRRALLEIGRAYSCEGCGNAGVWCDGPLRLEVDHIDGDFHHNNRDNLRFLCPNCHAQTANFSGRSRGKYAHSVSLPLLKINAEDS